MSWEIIHELAAESTCPYCKAGPGQRCRTSSGKRTLTHSPRTRPFMAAFWAGYEDAREDLYTSHRDNHDAFEHQSARYFARKQQ